MSQTQQITVADHIEAERQNQDAVNRFFRQADILPHYPMSLDTGVEVLQAAEYDVSRDYVLQLLEDKVISPFERHNGRMSLNATDVIALATILEARRRWKSFSKLHGHKLNQFEKLTELAGKHGESSCFNDLNEWDLGGLISLLDEPGCELPIRQAIAVALKAKLKTKGIEV